LNLPNIIKWISRFTWEIIQTSLGAFLYLGFKVMKFDHEFSIYKNSFYIKNDLIGVSLGAFVFGTSKEVYALFGYADPTKEEENTKKHEYGHSIQSAIFGPLYLFVIGYPSVVVNILTRFRVLKPANYYKVFPENWADKLGQVDR
jgi:hypothetical protein